MLWVRDLEAAINYYVQTLGFICTAHANGWAEVNKDEVFIMFSLPNEHIPHNELQFTGSFYLNTDDAAAWWEKLKDTADVLYPLEDFEYGMREFAIRDCNGYILQFGSEL